MTAIGKLGLLMATLVLATGCTRMVDGAVEPAPDLAPKPLTGQNVAQALPEMDELTDILEQQLKEDTYVDPRSGGLDDMPDGLATESDASPHDCVGAVTPMQRSTYESAAVTDIAGEQWEGDEPGGAVLAAEAGVVALDSVASANELFDAFAEQWQDCEGTTVTIVKEQVRGGYFTDTVSDVRVEDSIVAATVDFGHTIDGSSSPVARALGVRANCLVEVDVAFFSNPSSRKGGDVETSAIEIARLMMDKISELS
ncbi:sensor domain-containing protein [Mycobacterium sp. LTG2003]